MAITALEEVRFFKVFKVFALRTRAQDDSSIVMCQGRGATCSAQTATRKNVPAGLAHLAHVYVHIYAVDRRGTSQQGKRAAWRAAPRVRVTCTGFTRHHPQGTWGEQGESVHKRKTESLFLPVFSFSFAFKAVILLCAK